MFLILILNLMPMMNLTFVMNYRSVSRKSCAKSKGVIVIAR